jgi:Ser/Thr protein kinase RdoA (MazF antagonist)
MDQREAAAAYAALSEQDQVEVLRPLAAAAAARFGLEVASLDVLMHAYNTTFALTTPAGERYALRVNTNSDSTPEQVLAQQAWQVAIAAQSPVQVPAPRPTTEGAWAAAVPCEPLGREVLVTCASWLAGEDVGDPEPEVAHDLGRAMAHLHRQARTWGPPAGAVLPRFDGPLFGDPDRLGSATLPTGQREVLDRAMKTTTAAFARVHTAGPVLPIHADLHGGNLKWHEGRLAVFDFDDCGIGTPALDLAISVFYLRGGDDAAEQALRKGYAEVAPLPAVSGDDFEALVASRQLLLANDLLGTTTAALRAQAESYLTTSVERLRHWLATGRFTRVLP